MGQRTLFRTLFWIALLTLFFAVALQAQQYSGTITGTVTDPQGAAIPNAPVTAVNIGTNATYNATTSAQGYYSFAQLPVGTYEVHVKVGSYKEFIAKSVEVHTSSITTVDAKLELGAVTETVTVETSDVQVQTESASVGEVVEGQQVRELPLNGENFMNLVTLSPGVSAAKDFDARDKGLTGGSDFSVNGNPYTNNLFLVDGVNNVDMGSGRTILVYPSVDTIAEFKMIRNSYGPEYGQASGAIISITTKSGTNQFHGGVFYAGRNDALDAYDWFTKFNNAGSPNIQKQELRRNDWGYNIEGPVIKNKLFFWWNQEWNREIRGQSVARCVPSAAEKAGDFSGTLNCGATAPTIPVADQAPGNPLKIANPDKAGLLMAQFYPDPNIPGVSNGNNWVSSENQHTNWSEWNVRADYDITQKHRATFRWTQDSWESPAPNPNLFWGDTVFPSLQSDWSQPSKSVMGKLTSQLSNSLVNDAEFGYGHNAIITSLTPNSVGYVNAVNAAIPTAWPSSLKQPGAFINGGGAWGGLSPYGSGETMWTIAPYGNHEDLYALQDNVSKVQGNHLFKAGVYWSSNAKVEDNNGGSDRPAIPGNPYICTVGTAGCTASGFQTNNQLANVLLPGQIVSSGENSVNATDYRIWHDFEWYVGDTWKVRKNVTLSYGFRWSFYREPYSETNAQANFNLADWSAARATAAPSDACNGVVIVPGTNPCGNAASQLASLGIALPLSNGTPGSNRALVNNNNHDIAPRVGIAWDVKGDGKTAVRLGAGQFYQRELIGIGRTLSQTAPFVIGATDVRTLDSATPLSNPSVSPNAAKDPRGVTPNSWQWNVSVERQIIPDTTLQVGYVGNTGIHLTSMLDLNEIPTSNWVAGAFSGGSAQNALRPAFNFGTIGDFSRAGHATYHALQALFRSRLGNYSTFQAAYTWSHSIGDVELDNSSGGLNQEAFINPANTALDKGNTNINRPNIFVLNWVGYLPKFTNKSNFVQQTLGGWQVNGIVSINDGASLSVFSNGASGTSENWCQAVAGGTWSPANCAGTPFAKETVNSPLTSLTGNGYGNNNRADRGSVSCEADAGAVIPGHGPQFLNPSAFTFVGYTLGTVGNVGRGSCYGPNLRNVDMQLAKNWNFKERYRIKFSMDFFNLFNHANFPGSELNAAGFSANGLHCNDAMGPCGMSVNPTTGVATTNLSNNVVTSQDAGQNTYFGIVNKVNPGRELQYTLRFYF